MAKLTNEMELAAANAALRREIEAVQEKIPNFVPYSGPVPKTLAEFGDLPEPWRDQVRQENEGLVQDLVNKQTITSALAESDRFEARRRELLKPLGIENVEQFNALPPRERQKMAAKMTDDQKNALTGLMPATEEHLL